jgi:hypothetical protein
MTAVCAFETSRLRRESTGSQAVIADRDGGSRSLGKAAIQRRKTSASMFALPETLNSGDTACGAKNPLLKIEIGGQHYHVANCHAAWPCQHKHHHFRHFAGLQQTSGLLGLLQLLRRPVREQCADDGAG